ncbi:hypothetical protein AaE_015175 [Aphanomyces astaci]|uniref:Protein kinase domain-containing protein n=2 Tax=Aphanomyces astaci TaxID=112090 RepID=A0A6A4Z9M5_APHAT|nr:hypothetical protein AaE_015175 [Aphanomyces astaci]
MPPPTTSAVHVTTWVVVGALAAAMVVYTMKKTPSEDSNDRDVISPPSSSSQPDIPTEAAPSSPKVVTATTAPPLSFKETYTLGKRLGAGAFAIVREGVNKVTGTKFAVKCIKTSSLSPADVRGLRQEISILKQLSHPNIMSLHDVIEEPNVTYLVTEYIAGGELFDRIVEKTFYSENEARELVRILLGAIKYCHDHNVVHRDLKVYPFRSHSAPIPLHLMHPLHVYM